jgi:hypothetical protein
MSISNKPADQSSPRVTISTPVNGGYFDGNATGMFSPATGSNVTVSFWQYGPPAPGVGPDVSGIATLRTPALVWTIDLDVSDYPTTTGFLQVVNTVGGVASTPAEVENLQVG